VTHSIATPATTLTTAADALHDEEIQRTRAFLRMGWAVAIGVVAATLLVPGNLQIRIALLVAIGVAVAGSTWIEVQLKNPLRYDPRKITALALVCVVCGQLGILYVGYFSAASLIVLLGLCFFCRTESAAAAIAIYVLAAGAHAVLAVLVIAGVVADPGFYPIKHVSVGAQIVGHLIVQQGYATCFWLARLARRASLRSIEQLQEATRLAAQRDAQVEELRRDLNRALKVGGPGRFTGHVFGAWELGTVLGRGGMGEVYEGAHMNGDVAAVKVLRRELLAERQNVERFLREVRVVSSLDSPHVVKVLQASTPEDPVPFLAMERLHGQTLGEMLRDRTTLPRARVAELVAAVARVLEQTQRAEIVHRDLKPHNLFLTEADTWKILDFGLAILGETSGTLTQGAIVGTPAYMAPEQAKGEPVDHRADLYALGAVIYRCLTGQLPFVTLNTPSTLFAVVHHMPLRPSAIAAVPQDIEDVLAIALAKSKDDRFQTAGELAAAYADAERGALADTLRRRARNMYRRQPWRELDTDPTEVVRR
jgi:eukaryotic-like serine/threonine-protein kinase